MSLLHSFSFRLAATYAALFIASVALLLGTFHWVSIAAPRAQVEARLFAESNALAESYRNGDRDDLAAALERRARQPSPRAAFHLLADPEGRVVTTNLPSWPRFAGQRWVTIEADIYRDGDEDDYKAYAADRMLGDGSRLLVGRDIEDIDELAEAITDAAFYLIGGAILLALLGGLVMNRAIGRRIEAVSSAARQVIAGDLARRVEIRGSGDDFDRLAETLNLMLERIEAGVDAVRRVSDSVAHELRTPLARLQSHLQEMNATGDGENADDLARAIDEADRLQSIFDAVLRIARIESGRHGASFAPVDMAEVLADAAELYAPAAEDRDIVLGTGLEPTLIVAGDRDLLFQAVSNLLDNAIKFTPPGGKIDVRAAKAAGEVVIDVIDTGPGIAADLIKHAGERFFRAPLAAGVPGFGLGLSLVSAVAELHNSVLSFEGGNTGLRVEWRIPWSGERGS